LDRRNIIVLLGGAVAWPFAARAQQKTMPVIGYLAPGSPEGPALSTLTAFRQGLTDAG